MSQYGGLKVTLHSWSQLKQNPCMHFETLLNGTLGSIASLTLKEIIDLQKILFMVLP